MDIGLSHYLTVAAILFTPRNFWDFSQPEESHHHPHVD